MSDSASWARRLAWLQGMFYQLGGLWPLLHLRSFLAVTGPKTDLWLVQTVGAMLAVIGGVLIMVAVRSRVTREWQLLAAGQAAVLAIIDVVFVSRDVIPPIYLADAAAEIALVVAWMAVAVRSRE